MASIPSGNASGHHATTGPRCHRGLLGQLWALVLGTLVGAGLWLLRATWRVKVEGDVPKYSLLFAFFHGDMLPLVALPVPKKPTLLVSLSRDGDMSAVASRFLGYGVARGSTSRGAVAGAMNLARGLRGGQPAALAVDGPRGPVGVAGESAGRLAAMGKAELVAVAAAAHGWRLRSWDRMLVPRPFARVRIVVRQVGEGEELQRVLDVAAKRALELFGGKDVG